MATIIKEALIAAPAEQVWAALADVGALHTKLAPGFVIDTKLEPGARLVTFANGQTAKELIVSVDPERRRVAWSAVGGRLTHHNASAQVIAEGEGRCRFVWTADLLPDALAPAIEGMIAQGLAAIQGAMERAAA
jgi:hypothetical protein